MRRESADEMLRALLGEGKDRISLKRLIIERTEGTPFFMEEMVPALFEDGVLQRNGAVKLAKSMAAVKVPATVQAILTARIDRLPSDEKDLLQALAVIGKEFQLSLPPSPTIGSTGCWATCSSPSSLAKNPRLAISRTASFTR
jgi:predicted ATPase